MKKLLVAVLGLLSVACANTENVPDYSAIDSREKALALVEKGELVEMLLFPTELGGHDWPPNRVFVPVDALATQTQITKNLILYAQDGLIDSMDVDAEYKGDSFVPTEITFSTSYAGKATKYNPVIQI
uniref:hypothetical protein n=1 Tax=Thaumasiovibrio occultus TaxID=1891184 RepID=UPI000B34CF6F|nr:hypothetical protein [Thaumasiovibrio occultus]